MPRVVFLTTVLTHYRIPFHEGVRKRLAASGIKYDLIFGQPSKDQAEKSDCGSVSWGTQIVNKYIEIGQSSIVWQPALKHIWNCDLAILGQENRLVINYLAQTFRSFRRPKLALFGHGRNFQAGPTASLTERWKRFWATKCDWWFAYTNETRKLIESYGFPSDHITVFYNSIDTSEIRRLASQIDDAELSTLRAQLGIATDKIAIYVGGIYSHKRIDFLIEAALEIRRRVPDFMLIIVGSGNDRLRVEAAAASYSWIRYLGPRFGREKVALLRLSRVFVMPGLVGLAILDCASAGLPIVTTAYPYHSPEIAYLVPGRNGVMVEDWRSVTAYADAVIAVLQDDKLQKALVAGASEIAQLYSIENMINHFVSGVMEALSLMDVKSQMR